MAADAKQPPALFDPTGFETFRFTARELDASGQVMLRYALDDEVDFVEVLEPADRRTRVRCRGRGYPTERT